MLRHALILASLFAFGGCASFGGYVVQINQVDWPLLDLQRAVAAELPVGLRNTSPNGREFYSKYYVLSKNKYKPAGEATERFTAQVTILGAERPYDLEISVTREVRVLRDGDFDYAVDGQDKGLAKELEYKLHQVLSKRREERNFIDDFRVF